MELSTYSVYFIDPNLPPHVHATFWCDAISEEHAIEQWEQDHPNCELEDVTNVGRREE